MKETIKFEVELDENKLPSNIQMYTNNDLKSNQDLRALMISGWDTKNNETLRVDLWTKDMPVNEMFIFYHQSMMSMASTLERATGEERLADALRDYCEFFAKETKIKSLR